MNNLGTKLAAVAFLACVTASPALAGRGGSAQQIRAAVATHSIDAIVAEIERAEALACSECADLVVPLLADDRYPVREVAAWWVAKRGSLHHSLIAPFTKDLTTGDAIAVRNAADFFGASSTFTSLPALRTAIRRDLTSEAKLAIVRAVDKLGNLGGNEVLTVAMADRDPAVRAAGVRAWRDIRNQQDAVPLIAMLDDASPLVRAEAATVMGGMRQLSATGKLEAMVVGDGDPIVRKNAAWALGKIGAASSRAALSAAVNDRSAYVRGVARASLAQLR